MREFKAYQHIVRYGLDEVLDIGFGKCHIFPKIDGTNASVWDNEGLNCGSRKRHLSIGSDNAGFLAHITDPVIAEKYIKYFEKHPNHRLFGEWLVPHSLKTYRGDTWKHFYVFDVVIDTNNIEDGMEYIQYEVYKEYLEEFGIDYIPCMAVITNPTHDQLIHWMGLNNFLIEDGKGAGEGIVIKNYGYRSRYGRQVWAKIVSSEFKEKHARAMGPCELNGKLSVEERIVDKYCTESFIEKEYAKLVLDLGWETKYIPMLLNKIFHELVDEESWNFIKDFSYPVINYKTLKSMVNIKIKQVKQELF